VALPAFACHTLPLQQLIDISYRWAHSSKPAAAAGEWDRRMDRRTDTVPFLRPCSAYCAAVPVMGIVDIELQVVTRLIHLLGHRILGSLGSQNPAAGHRTMSLSEHPNVDPRPAVANLASVAVLPASDGVPLSTFTLELQHALNAIGPTLRLSSDLVQLRLGSTALDPINDYRLSSWLGQQEDVHRMVLYECDRRLTPWTQRCIRQVLVLRAALCLLYELLTEQRPFTTTTV